MLGAIAESFVEFLAQSEVRYWQVLPLGPTGYGDSPYAAFSAFAGNPLLIDLQPLLDAGLLTFAELEPLRRLPDDHVDFGALYQAKWPILRLAHRRFHERKLAYLPNYGLYDNFLSREAGWLESYALFMALKEDQGGKPWTQWPVPLRTFDSAREMKHSAEIEARRSAHDFTQYLFAGQWNQVREKARINGVEIIGDIPIYVALDSADTWANPEIFELDETCRPTAVAGVPPDYFSATGQLWGNPLYNWKYLKKTQYAWWVERIRANFSLFDVIRLDHFRGFWDYWAIPADATDARGGEWRAGPQEGFFRALQEEFGSDCRIIAEDLGELSQEVHDFLTRLGLPGMAVLEFAFDGRDSSNLFLPHNLTQNQVVYAGTHDNDTVIGWYESQPDVVRDQVRRYFRISGDDVAWDFIRAAFRAPSRLAVFQMQDLLSLGGEARMNFPGTSPGNWQWRMTAEQFDWQRGSSSYLRELAWLYGRSVRPNA